MECQSHTIATPRARAHTCHKAKIVRSLDRYAIDARFLTLHIRVPFGRVCRRRAPLETLPAYSNALLSFLCAALGWVGARTHTVSLAVTLSHPAMVHGMQRCPFVSHPFLPVYALCLPARRRLSWRSPRALMRY